MGVTSKLIYSETYQCNVDPTDLTVFDVAVGRWGSAYGRIIPFYDLHGKYKINPYLRLTLHRIMCDAGVYNPRPDLFDMTDHINGDTHDNRVSNLRHVNKHLNNLNQHAVDQNIYKQKYWVKNGKVFTIYRFSKCNAHLQSFRNIECARRFAKMFNCAHFDAIYKLYVESPELDTEEWREYWKKHLIPGNLYVRKTHHALILSRKKYVVSAGIYEKLTTKRT